MGFDEALRRGEAAARAGADVLFIEAPRDEAQVERVAAAFDMPLLYNYAAGRPLTAAALPRLRDLGYAIVILPVDTLLVATKAMADFLGALRARDEVRSLGDRYVPFADFNALIGVTEQMALADRYREDACAGGAASPVPRFENSSPPGRHHHPPGGFMSNVETLNRSGGRPRGGRAGALARRIHDNPELAYREEKASGWLADFLEAGCQVERGRRRGDRLPGEVRDGAGPTIAILGEYDALPEIGHACGHNVIATAAAGAGAAAARRLRDALPAGRLLVIGTPAEEGGGGKVRLIEVASSRASTSP